MKLTILGSFLLIISSESFAKGPQITAFPSGDLTLRGELFLPEVQSPFPVILYNHGSALKISL